MFFYRFDTNDAQYDIAWSEINERQLVAACGDGSIKLFDIGVAQAFPVMNFHEHKRETFAVSWNPVTKDSFVSSSWDGTIKIVSADLKGDQDPPPPPPFRLVPNTRLVVAYEDKFDHDAPGGKLHI